MRRVVFRFLCTLRELLSGTSLHPLASRAAGSLLVAAPVWTSCVLALSMSLAPGLLLGSSSVPARQLAPGVKAPHFSLPLLAEAPPRERTAAQGTGAGVETASPGAPSHALPLDDGGAASADRLFRAQPLTLLVFWNSECPACLEALLACQGMEDALSSQGVRLAAVNFDAVDLSAVRNFVTNSAILFPQLSDATGNVAAAYGADGFSFSLFLVDSDGIVRDVFYDRPADVEETMRSMVKGARERTHDSAKPLSPGEVALDNAGQPAPDEAPGESAEPLPPGGAATLPPRQDAGESRESPPVHRGFPPVEIKAQVRVRAMDIQIEHDPSVPAPPTGPYGERLEEGRSILHRFECEIAAHITSALRAGGLIRLSNESEDVLEFGPQYLSQKEGSAFADFRARHFSLRVGYFEEFFTPLSLMRWDRDDNPRAGGSGAGCACAGASGTVFLESLEELAPPLTFEGAAIGAGAGRLGDLRAFYARVRDPNEITFDEFLRDAESLSDFRYRRDLYGIRAQTSVPLAVRPESALFSAHYVTTRDDEESAHFVGSSTDSRGFALENQVYGGTLLLPLPGAFALSLEYDHSENVEDVRRSGGDKDEGDALLVTLKGTPLRGVTASAAYYCLSEGFYSSFAALSYATNRQVARAGLSFERGPFGWSVFAKHLSPCRAEVDYCPTPSLPPATCARFDGELTLGLWASARMPDSPFAREVGRFEFGGGWILQRESNEVYRPSDGIEPVPYTRSELCRKKNTVTGQITCIFAKSSSVELTYQYVDFEDEIESLNDYTAHRTSLQFSVGF
ncbi:MAG: TlpA disulfide reductase family protein [Candidatus Eisenbacteria bacterium]